MKSFIKLTNYLIAVLTVTVLFQAMAILTVKYFKSGQGVDIIMHSFANDTLLLNSQSTTENQPRRKRVSVISETLKKAGNRIFGNSSSKSEKVLTEIITDLNNDKPDLTSIDQLFENGFSDSYNDNEYKETDQSGSNNLEITVSEDFQISNLISQRLSETREKSEKIDNVIKARTSRQEVPELYTVNPGETISEISIKFGISSYEICKINNISDPRRLRAGQKLFLNGLSNQVQSSAKDSNPLIHTVSRGESLYTISQKYRIRLSQLIGENKLSSSKIFPGQKLVIPGKTIADISSLNNQFIWPARGRISSPYGMRTHPITKKMRFHEGIDIAIGTGTPIKAAADGKVTHSGWLGGYGKTVIISHGNGLETRYAHNSRLNVKKGQKVYQNQVISAAGSTGNSTGPHLHFEIRKNGKTQNPIRFLN